MARSHQGSPRAVLPDEHVRATYFVSRHEWWRVKKQWTCLAPDRPHGWSEHDFDNFVNNHRWVFARTQPTNPHEYTLRRNALHSVFDDAVRYIRDKGVLEYFVGKPYKMLHRLTHKFWTMGAPLDVTILINRKATASELVTAQPSVPAKPAPFSFLPESVEQLPRYECLDEDKRPLDVDDFEFLVHLIRESGTKSGGSWYLDLGGYVYWTRGVPEKAQAVHRARRPVGSSG